MKDPQFTKFALAADFTDRTVYFIATDILRVQDGRTTDNWYIEDNLTLMQQLGVVHR
jgi:hypothetical protein